MRKAQGSLEYLLILASVLAIAVVVVVVLNSMMSTPSEQNLINEEKYEASVTGAELIGYNALYDGYAESLPAVINYKGESFTTADGTLSIHKLGASYDDKVTDGCMFTLFTLGPEEFRVGYMKDCSGYDDGMVVEGHVYSINGFIGGPGFN